jgi:hypothetical protein
MGGSKMTPTPTPILFVLDEPTPPFPDIPQELLDDPYFQMLSVGNPTIYEDTNPQFFDKP